MSRLSLFAILLSLPVFGLFAQPVSFGLTPRLIAPVVTDAKIGQGWGTEAWSKAEIGPGNGIKLKLGYQQIGDYNSAVETKRTYVFPDRTIRQTEFARIKGLETWYVDLSFWQYTWDIKSRWSFELGARYSFSTQARGRYESRRSLTFGYGRTVALGFGEEMLRGRDFGLHLSGAFELFDGCWLEAQAYQGFLNQWRDFEDFEGPTVYVTTLSVGLAFRLF